VCYADRGVAESVSAAKPDADSSNNNKNKQVRAATPAVGAAAATITTAAMAATAAAAGAGVADSAVGVSESATTTATAHTVPMLTPTRIQRVQTHILIHSCQIRACNLTVIAAVVVAIVQAEQQVYQLVKTLFEVERMSLVRRQTVSLLHKVCLSVSVFVVTICCSVAKFALSECDLCVFCCCCCSWCGCCSALPYRNGSAAKQQVR